MPNELYGCINDARNVQRFLLRSSFFVFLAQITVSLSWCCTGNGYKHDDIKMMTDDATDPRLRPTKTNILDAMHWLVQGACPHDSLFFHCKWSPLLFVAFPAEHKTDSGHGAQVKDTDGDEVDGFDEGRSSSFCILAIGVSIPTTSDIPPGLQEVGVHRRRCGSHTFLHTVSDLLTSLTHTAFEYRPGPDASSRVPPHGEFRHAVPSWCPWQRF